MSRRKQAADSQWGRILLVDDDRDYNDATRRLLESEGFSVESAYGGEEALSLLGASGFDLMLLDYRMPGMDGAQVVRELRKRDENLQVLLQTGYASEKPPRDLLRELEIQGYFEKGEGVDRLLLWVEAGLKAARATRKNLYHRAGLGKVLDAAGRLHRLPEPDDALLEAARMGAQLASLSPSGRDREAACAVAAKRNDGVETAAWPASRDEEAGELAAAPAGCAERPLEDGASSMTLALRAGDTCMGSIKVWAEGLGEEDKSVLSVYAVQLAVALRNRQLYAMATRDPLTGVYVRKFYDQWIIKELRTAHRQKQCLSLVMLDLDDMKGVNDSLGHSAGDAALAHLGGTLKRASRSTDFIARFGGDEFVIILPATDSRGAATVAQKIVSLLASTPWPLAGGGKTLSASVGTTTLLPPKGVAGDGRANKPEYFEDMARSLLERADAMLYAVKRSGKSGYASDDGQDWL